MFTRDELEVLAMYDPGFMSPDPFSASGAYEPCALNGWRPRGPDMLGSGNSDVVGFGPFTELTSFLTSPVGVTLGVGIGIGYLLRGLLRR